MICPVCRGYKGFSVTYSYATVWETCNNCKGTGRVEEGEDGEE